MKSTRKSTSRSGIRKKLAHQKIGSSSAGIGSIGIPLASRNEIFEETTFLSAKWHQNIHEGVIRKIIIKRRHLHHLHHEGIVAHQ